MFLNFFYYFHVPFHEKYSSANCSPSLKCGGASLEVLNYKLCSWRLPQVIFCLYLSVLSFSSFLIFMIFIVVHSIYLLNTIIIFSDFCYQELKHFYLTLQNKSNRKLFKSKCSYLHVHDFFSKIKYEFIFLFPSTNFPLKSINPFRSRMRKH